MHKTSYLITILLLVSFFAFNPAVALSQKAIAISAGADHCLALADDGSVWQWGSDTGGALSGNSSGADQPFPTRVSIDDIIAISAGAYHNLALKNDGTVWTWGHFYGGNNGTSIPIQIPITDVKAIYASYSGGFAIKNDGTVLGWGDNSYGNIGDGTYINRATPVQVKISDVKSIDGRGAFAITNDGRLLAWGNNVYDLVGNNTYNGFLGDDSSNESRPIPFMVNELTGVKAVSAGHSHTLVLKDDAPVWGWGKDQYGQLGDGRTLGVFEYQNAPIKCSIENVKEISANGYQSMALKNDGTVWTWGAVKDNYGNDVDSNEPKMVPGLNGVTSISCGRSFFAALKTDGTVWVWGNNDHGQAGDGTNDKYKSSPVQVKLDYTGQSSAHPTLVLNNATVTSAPTIVNNGDTNDTTTPSQNGGLIFKLIGAAGLIILVGGIIYLVFVKHK